MFDFTFSSCSGVCSSTSTSVGSCTCTGATGEYCDTSIGGHQNSAVSLNIQKDVLNLSLLFCSLSLFLMYL